MSLTAFAKPKAGKVMGIDASTHTLAFAIVEGDKLLQVGEIDLQGDTFYERLIDCRTKADVILSRFSVDYISIEKAVAVKSPDTALKLGMIVGVVITSLATNSTKVQEIAPITWQSYIGNPNIIGKAKKDIIAQHPLKSKSWISSHIRELRKQRTKDWVLKKYGVKEDSDNVADAVGIATFTVEQLVS